MNKKAILFVLLLIVFSIAETEARVGSMKDPISKAELPTLPPKNMSDLKDWHLVGEGGNFWQKTSNLPTETPEETDAREGTRGDCQFAGMVEVKGQMREGLLSLDSKNPKNQINVEVLQQMNCKHNIHSDVFAKNDRCTEFDEEALSEKIKKFNQKSMHFCIDRFEYPNIVGQNPWIMISWPESKAICESQGKRLCNEDEWTFACEGEEALPYPYGYERSNDKCNIDKKWKVFHEKELLPRNEANAGFELARLWAGEESGTRKECRSPFGVYDLTGNVDEWTVSTRSLGLKTILKGGYWGPVRTRCRPSTRSHNDTHVFYQQGLRCCSDH